SVALDPAFARLTSLSRSAAVLCQSFGRKIALFKLALFFQTLLVRSGLGTGVGTIPMRLLELFPGGDAFRLKLLHKVPHRRPNHLMGKPRIPGNRRPERQMLVEPKIARQLSLHERERALDHGAGPTDLVL